MRKPATIMGLLVLVTAIWGCVEQASDAELQSMCENLVKVRKEVDMSSEAELIAEVDESFKREEKRLRDWKARDLKGWDDELAAKLADVTDVAEREKLTQEYEKKKAITASKHDPGIEGLKGKRLAAIEKAKQKAIKNKSLYDDKVKTCVTDGKKEAVSKKVAQCRINAKSPDEYWNKCR